jgi:hypothetical protein
MKLITVASSSTPFTKDDDGMKFQGRVKQAQERAKQAEGRAKLRRDVFEKPREVTAKRLQKDVQKIAKDEVEFSKRLLKELIPIEISIDKEASGLKALIPLNIAFTNNEAPDIKAKAKDTDTESAFDGSDSVSAYLDDEIIP